MQEVVLIILICGVLEKQTRTIEVTQAGTYTITISNGVCSKSYSAVVTYTHLPDLLEIIYENDVLKILVKNYENLPLEFSIDNGVIWQSSDTFYQVLKNTEYTVRVRNAGTLCDVSVPYYTFFLPNVITPNGDGRDDTISFAGIVKRKDFSATIFNRYGQQIFKASENNPIWDGQYLGRPVNTDTYWYRISWEDPVSGKPVTKSGWILVKNRDN